MTPVAPFLPGIETSLYGHARRTAREQAAWYARTLKNKPISHLALLLRRWVPQSLLKPTTHGAHSRRRVFSLPVVFWTFLAQALSPRMPAREAVRKIQAWCAGNRYRLPSSNTGAYCKARAALPPRRLKEIHAAVASAVEHAVPPAERWRGRRALVVDGTCLSMPDTKSNRRAFPQPSGQKRGCGFPVVKVVALFSLASGALLDWVEGTWRQNDARLWRKLWRLLVPGDIILGDRAFCSYGAITELLKRGVDVLFRLHQSRSTPNHRSTTRLGRNDYLVTWTKPQHLTPLWTKRQWAALPKTITVRVLKVWVTVRGYRTRSLHLVTSLLDPVAYPADEVARMYLRRWSVELFFRDIKTTMRMETLSGLSPRVIRLEVCMFAIAYTLLRALMQNAARAYHIAASRLSFKGTMDTVRQWADVFTRAAHTPHVRRLLFDRLLAVIAADPVPLRPHRAEPRAVKRRPKSYHLLTKPRHRMFVPPHRSRPKPASQQRP